MLEQGYDIRTVQELLGHSDAPTTERYLHVMNRGGLGVISPLDRGERGIKKNPAFAGFLFAMRAWLLRFLWPGISLSRSGPVLWLPLRHPDDEPVG